MEAAKPARAGWSEAGLGVGEDMVVGLVGGVW